MHIYEQFNLISLSLCDAVIIPGFQDHDRAQTYISSCFCLFAVFSSGTPRYEYI